MRTISRHIIWLILFLPLLGCAKKEATYEGSGSDQRIDQEAEGAEASKYVAEDRKLIRTGEIQFESYDMEKTRNAIDSATKDSNGYVSKENKYTQSSRIQQNLVIRVPAENFEKLVRMITSTADRIDSENIESNDVTEEYIDTEIRIRIKKETEKRYRDLLKLAKTVDEILSIERYLDGIRTEIETLEGRIKYLENRISYATLTVSYYQSISIPAGFANQFKSAIGNGWNNFVWFLVGLVNVWPFLVIILAAVPAIRIVRARRKKKG